MRSHLTAAAAILVASPLSAQVEQRLVPGGVFEVETAERVIAERQIPELIPWTADHIVLTLDSVRSDASGAMVWLAPNSVQSFGLRLRTDGHFERGSFEDVRRARYPDTPLDSLAFEYGRLRGRAGQVAFQELRAWDLVPVLPPGIELGATWQDTLSAIASRDRHLEEWRGVRTYEVVGDTIVGGRGHWRLRERAELTHRSTVLTRDWSFQDFRSRAQTLRGVLTGYSLVDQESLALLTRIDTLSVDGAQEVTLPDGRAFDTQVTWERTRRVVHRTEDAARLRRDSLQAGPAYGRARVPGPGHPIQARIDDRDPALLDSLIAVARDADSGEERVAALAVLRRSLGGPPHTPAWRDALLAIGDTAQALTAAASGTIDDEDVALLLPFLEDPSRLHAHGLRSERLLLSLRDRLRAAPPAVVRLQWDIGGEACTPSACAAIAELFGHPTDSRLADLGLFARFALDPARWYEALAARPTPFLDEAKRLLGPVGAGLEIPPIGASVEEWATWMDWPTDSARLFPAWPYERTHAVRFAEQISGRDIVAELRAGYEAASDERSRRVFGFPLSHVADDFFRADEIGELVRGGFEADRLLLQWHLFRPDGTPLSWEAAPAADADAILREAHEIFIDGAPRWDTLDGVEYEYGTWFIGDFDEPMFAIADEVPADVARTWGDRVDFVDAEAFDAERRELREHVMLTWRPVLAFGALRRMTLSYLQFTELELRGGPQLIQNFADYTAVLIRDGDRWVAVGLSYGRGH